MARQKVGKMGRFIICHDRRSVCVDISRKIIKAVAKRGFCISSTMFLLANTDEKIVSAERGSMAYVPVDELRKCDTVWRHHAKERMILRDIKMIDFFDDAVNEIVKILEM